MEANKIGCRTCGGTSFTKTDKIAKCDYCGAEYDIEEFRARLACLEAEQKTLDSLADNVARLRELADQKEAERQKAIEEEEKQRQEDLRKQKEAQNIYEAAQKEKEEEKKLNIKRNSFGCLFIIVYLIFFYDPINDFIMDSKMPTAVIVFMVFLSWITPVSIPILVFPPKKKKKK